MRRLLSITIFFACTCAGGWLLACIATSFPFEMPVFLYHFIRRSIAISGFDKLDNPEDIQTLGLLCLIAACWVFAALTTWTVMLFIRRRQRPSHRL